jgi:hypothetical protein
MHVKGVIMSERKHQVGKTKYTCKKNMESKVPKMGQTMQCKKEMHAKQYDSKATVLPKYSTKPDVSPGDGRFCMA